MYQEGMPNHERSQSGEAILPFTFHIEFKFHLQKYYTTSPISSLHSCPTSDSVLDDYRLAQAMEPFSQSLLSTIHASQKDDLKQDTSKP